jgi:hypothetical protein
MAVTASIQQAVKGARYTKERPTAHEQWTVVVEEKEGKHPFRLTTVITGNQDAATEAAREMADDPDSRSKFSPRRRPPNGVRCVPPRRRP